MSVVTPCPEHSFWGAVYAGRACVCARVFVRACMCMLCACVSKCVCVWGGGGGLCTWGEHGCVCVGVCVCGGGGGKGGVCFLHTKYFII